MSQNFALFFLCAYSRNVLIEALFGYVTPVSRAHSCPGV